MRTKYKLKGFVRRGGFRRGGALLGAVGFMVAIGIASIPPHVFADALNPLTERSLTLSSSSPGWSFTDGSGNATYAPPNSGANGQKTGNTFAFRVSSTETVKAITFQYCTKPAGECVSPGDNDYGVGTGTIDLTDSDPEVTGTNTSFDTELVEGGRIATAGGNIYTIDTIDGPTSLTLTTAATDTESGVSFNYRNPDSTSTTDLNVVFDDVNTPSLISDQDWASIDGSADKTPERDGSEGTFVVLTGDASDSATSADTYTSATDWDVAATNNETYDLSDYQPGPPETGLSTGQNNFITLTSANGIPLAYDATNGGDYVKVIFFGTDDNYITNPGSGAFFVRMNTYSDDQTLDETTLIDGGVTVANVMNESISIRTKVLETMDFSVGTYDPNLYLEDTLTGVGEDPHEQCSTLLMADPDSPTYSTDEHNVLNLGDPGAESSLATDETFAVQSYWRLSSNSSGGATVYYTGHTLTNTVGDEIQPLGEQTGGTSPNPGTEQFGLGIAHDTETTLFGTESYPVWLSPGESYGDEDDGSTDDGGNPDFASFIWAAMDSAETDLAGIDDYVHYPRLYPLVPTAAYANSAGDLDAQVNPPGFSFNANADTFAIPLATNSEQVVNCVTAKMRYMANIAATTPAGIYTTKINYVASPQY